MAQSSPEPDPDAGVDPTLPGVDDVAALGRFPFCQCQDYRCSTSPYRLVSIPSPTKRPGELCYRIDRVGCSQANPCCKMLLDTLGKVEFSVEETCKSDYINAAVNGVFQNSYFDTDFPTGKIRVTPLRMNVNTATNSTICLRMRANSTCASYSGLCGNSNGMCTYAVFESSNHQCCPICAQALPPPPPVQPAFRPPPPPPPPPSPPPPPPHLLPLPPRPPPPLPPPPPPSPAPSATPPRSSPSLRLPSIPSAAASPPPPPPPNAAPSWVPKCDCISSFIKSTSRFRLEYDRSIATADEVTYQFRLYVVRPQDCWAPGYKGGTCCNQTLVNVGLSLQDSIKEEELGDVTLTTDKGKVLRVTKTRTFWGVELWPNDDTQGRFYTPSLYVTNFTVDVPWTLSVPLVNTAVNNPSKWPCKASRYLPNDPNVCDIMLNGYQTVIGKPTQILDINQTIYDIPNCCPEGLIRFDRVDNCCVDNLAENPFRLGFTGSNPSVKDDTVLSFDISYKGASPNGPFGGIFDGTRPNCSTSEVDQLQIYVAPTSVDYVYRIEVDGSEVDFTKNKERYSSWVRAINLHKVTRSPSQVKLFLSKDVQPADVCTAKVAESPLCEYVLKGAYDDDVDEYMCCPHGATAVNAASCPA
ncbi:hypothetical protein HYH03_012330 [Edaphochlamys debaryana]|uniref:Pherophorin domain-containing protein n=1 Tax=Edaphochlamys debaryana TaxID=47281 RepID=A0A835XST7_9CHLO|nr:hypothetical protein HYH03_012330 [Edaphochlamys debaryana]|eukprot:KAG2489104.1 hypothetical protein HYH03_012330 [Edaphochlamys debaryana]